MNIAANLKHTREIIEESANANNRTSEDIILVAVTKTASTEEMQELIDLGVTHVGESKVQEITRKYEILGDQVKWHMIGHLQKNKVKYIVDKVEYIHSLDSYELALEIEKRAGRINRRVKCLMEVNISGEESKYGLAPSAVKSMLEKFAEFQHVTIVGLMTMAPYVEDPEETRQYFRGLKLLADEVRDMNLKNISMDYLSMGMSNDFQVAIEEGANMVRVGSKLFT
ncbi:YggS family pyridoxal phosphate-dependent enzyme [Alkaliphilus hydrothermalis]|uniref:Pyridoxal phosphate homeostasis protein n=1 Tax=Alkaliphilus hydrothermalis TaxID=1482730 RepID=A0ABS2NNY5_9FIRM|nr:YggS family pyridoxal phosphate-dependent enzyme [Alkaliphilus hydrothermalis]MBM7614537.1 pyridoxal phosphate enzyme (YggS family) [Alkaliphilus hydrothermalis]